MRQPRPSSPPTTRRPRPSSPRWTGSAGASGTTSRGPTVVVGDVRCLAVARCDVERRLGRDRAAPLRHHRRRDATASQSNVDPLRLRGGATASSSRVDRQGLGRVTSSSSRPARASRRRHGVAVDTSTGTAARWRQDVAADGRRDAPCRRRGRRRGVDPARLRRRATTWRRHVDRHGSAGATTSRRHVDLRGSVRNEDGRAMPRVRRGRRRATRVGMRSRPRRRATTACRA